MTKNYTRLLHSPTHLRDRMVSSTLSDNLREQYNARSCRVIKGDSVKVVRGEYSGIEGKVERVNTKKGSLSIEGIQREKVKGGNVKVQIHSSNVIIMSLNLEDKYRQKKIQRKLNISTEAAERSRKRGEKSKKRTKTVRNQGDAEQK
jgi:large subunit ribosomal protein L24